MFFFKKRYDIQSNEVLFEKMILGLIKYWGKIMN